MKLQLIILQLLRLLFLEGIISVSKDGEIRIWNRFFISEIEWKCVQTLNVRCEALNAPGQPVAWPTKALFPGPISNVFRDTYFIQTL